jgi:hypothetical protein
VVVVEEEEKAVEDHDDDDPGQGLHLIQVLLQHAEALDHLLMAVEPYVAASFAEDLEQPFCLQQMLQPS